MRNVWGLAAGLLLGALATLGAQEANDPSLGTDPIVTGYSVVVEQPAGDTVKAGQTVAITGANFGVKPGMVQVGCEDVLPLSWSPNRITIVVPNTPAQQSVQLTVFCSSPQLYYRTRAWKVAP